MISNFPSDISQKNQFSLKEIIDFPSRQIPNEYPIVGVKLIDDNPPINVEFVEGNIGDKQIVIQISVDGFKLDTLFIFYHNPPISVTP